VIKQIKHYTREFIRAHPDDIFVYGSNMQGNGWRGQAKEACGEPNTVGIPTKWLPSNKAEAFFSEDDFFKVQVKIDTAFLKLQRHLKAGKTVYWPEDGIGTGRARLRECAPSIYTYISDWYKKLLIL